MADDLASLCQADQLDVHVTIQQIIEKINERAQFLSHFQLSLSFKIQTLRMFYLRTTDDCFDADEANSTNNEVTQQISTIRSLRSIVYDTYTYIRRLERIVFMKMDRTN